MKLDLNEIHNRVRTDGVFKKKVRRLVLFAGLGAVFIFILAVVGIVFFSSAILGFLFANAPGIFELGFNYVREFVGTYMQKDLTAVLDTLTGGTNVDEMKNLVSQYFNQLSSNPAIDFQNFQDFVITVKKSLLDNQITNTELESVKQFVMN